MKRRKQLESIAAIVLLFVLVGRWQRSWYYVWAGAGLFLLSLVWSGLRKGLSFYWMKVGEWIGAVTGRVLLTLIFVIIVIPLSFFARWRKRLNIRRDETTSNFRSGTIRIRRRIFRIPGRQEARGVSAVPGKFEQQPDMHSERQDEGEQVPRQAAVLKAESHAVVAGW